MGSFGNEFNVVSKKEHLFLKKFRQVVSINKEEYRSDNRALWDPAFSTPGIRYNPFTAIVRYAINAQEAGQFRPGYSDGEWWADFVGMEGVYDDLLILRQAASKAYNAMVPHVIAVPSR